MVQKAERISGKSGKPLGNVTRGTTNPNRMRRVDRWLSGTQAHRLRAAETPLIVDLGYGASPATAVELFTRMRQVRADVQLIGIEIEPERVRAAQALEVDGLSFQLGGFELAVPTKPIVVRAFNVLRQYQENDVPGIWRLVGSKLAPGGLFVEGTCDEVGRRASWVAVDATGPQTLSFSMRFGTFTLPSEVAERLPKALIHRNVPGEQIHTFLQAIDRCWLESAPLASFGNRQRWVRMCQQLRAENWPIYDGVSRWRLGELTVAWDAVAPENFSF
ncbi:class I SAM-dependent methyltransferase [Pseudarthrobacter sp. J1738]|uniref:class I SAM-dependent methyltransferase n=1 Tax=Pseudarthrobacter sp. J1738 TaxID=3420446 RepID=UPI003D2DBAB0